MTTLGLRWRISDGCTGWVDGIWDEFAAFATPIIQTISDFFSTTLGTAFDLLKASWEATMGVIKGVWNTFVQPLVNLFTGAFTGGMALLQGDFSGAMEAVRGIWDNVVMPLIQPFVDLFKTGMALVKGDWDSVMTGLKNVWDGTIKPLVGRFLNPFLNALKSIRERWSVMVEKMRQRFGFIDAIFTKLEEFKGKFKLIREKWSSMVKIMKQRFTAFIGPLKERLKATFDSLKEKLDTLKTRFGELKTKAIEFRDNIVTGFRDHIQPKVEALKKVIENFKEAYDKVKGGVTGTVGAVRDALPKFASGGVASGPAAGYPVMLHGTEAVVPLNMIQQEVSRALGGTTMRGRF